VFKLSPPKNKGEGWKEQVLYSFKGVPQGESGDGADPNGGLVLDSKGNIYGTTYFGGNASGECAKGVGGTGCGTVFELQAGKQGHPWTRTIIFRFNGQNGASPAAGVVFDKVRNLLGTTFAGGDHGNGLVFELKGPTARSQKWTENILYRFSDGPDGSGPDAGTSFDQYGNIYGTTAIATNRNAQGNVFTLKSGTAFHVLYTFQGTPDGAHPTSNVFQGVGGGLFGTTSQGGTSQNCQGSCGTVFEVSP
jgi:hypothetical protein